MSQALSRASQRFRYRSLDPPLSSHYLIHIATSKPGACPRKAFNVCNTLVTNISFSVCHDLIFFILSQD